MEFGSIPTADAEGALLAHALVVGGSRFDKGRRLTRADVATLAAADIETVIAARLAATDLDETAAADAIADAFRGLGLRRRRAPGGRVDLFATADGLLDLDPAAIERLNLVDEAITVATLPNRARVSAGERVATIKIIPLALPRATVARAVATLAAGERSLDVRAFRPLRVGLIQTRLPHVGAKVLDKTVASIATRLAGLRASLDRAVVVPHTSAPLAEEIRLQAAGLDLVLVIGASAAIDRRDVAPSAIVEAGGSIERHGMPVEPGNLLTLGRVGSTPVVVLPGCARNTAANGLDFVLERLAADLPVTAADIARMGLGGLLATTPRRAAKLAPPPRRIAAIVLAAGASSRMGTENKLLRHFAGRPMVHHPIRAALDAGLEPVVVVTGHEAGRVAAEIADHPVEIVHNPDWAGGLSTSLRAGLASLPPSVDAVVVLLGDMPHVGEVHLRRLVEAFAPERGETIVAPRVEGRWGNPMLWGRVHFAEIAGLDGDQGARPVALRHRDSVAEVPFDDAAAATDYDRPEDWLLGGDSVAG